MENTGAISNKADNRRQTLLILLCWFAYFTSYFGRYSYNANIIPIENAFGVTHAQSGLVVTFYFFSYGAGQIVHSLLCKKYPFRYVLTAVLVIAAAINLSIGFGLPFGAMKYAFVLNGICQAALWPSVVTILARNLDDRNVKRSTFAMATPVTLGTLSIYGISAICALSGGYKMPFIISGSVIAAGAVVWFFAYGKLATDPYRKPENAPKQTSSATPEKGKSEYIPMLVLLASFCMIVNFLKDGLQTWVPSIMKESFGLGDSLSLFLTLVLPVFGMLGSLTGVFFHTLIPDCVLHVGLNFALSAVLLVAVMYLLGTPLYILVLVCFSIVMFLSHGSNNIMTSVAPLGLRERFDSGMLAGLLNGCCYVGSTLSSYGLGAIADAKGWSGVSVTLLVAALVPVAVAAVYAILKLFRKRRTNHSSTGGR